MAKKVIVHEFYANEKCVWRAEWYEPMDINKLKQQAAHVHEIGYGDVDVVTDSTGRLVRLK